MYIRKHVQRMRELHFTIKHIIVVMYSLFVSPSGPQKAGNVAQQNRIKSSPETIKKYKPLLIVAYESR